MRTINLKNIAIIGFITAFDLAVGTYDRLVPDRGILYFLQKSILFDYGRVPTGFTNLNVTNTGGFIAMNTMASFNMTSTTILVFIVALIVAMLLGLLSFHGGAR